MSNRGSVLLHIHVFGARVGDNEVVSHLGSGRGLTLIEGEQDGCGGRQLEEVADGFRGLTLGQNLEEEEEDGLEGIVRKWWTPWSEIFNIYE